LAKLEEFLIKTGSFSILFLHLFQKPFQFFILSVSQSRSYNITLLGDSKDDTKVSSIIEDFQSKLNIANAEITSEREKVTVLC
jgi:hypothetical protein